MSLTYTKYNAKKLSGEYDVAIIGSGLGGLAAGVLLSKAGKRVIILERHFKPGGFTHTFKRPGYEWDVGVHYVGQVNDNSSMMKKLFDVVTENNLEWDDAGEIYDQAIIEGETFNFRKGKDNLKADLKERFPDEHIAIDKYFKLLGGAEVAAGLFFGERTMPPLMSKTIGYFLRRKLLPYCNKTTLTELKKLTSNEALLAIMCTQCGNYGLPPDRSSLAMHTTIVNHYMNGSAYPKGGASQIFTTMSKVITKLGGEIYVRAEVESIETIGRKVSHLKMKDGTQVIAKNYISNCGLHNTYNHLIKNDTRIANEKSQLSNIKPSTSHMCLYAGFNASDKKLGFPKYNKWVYRSKNFSEDFDTFSRDPTAPLPLTYISFPSCKDSVWQSKNPNKATIQVVVPANFSWFEEWKNTPWKNRPESYNVFKENFKARILKQFFEHFPDAEQHLDHAELSTPLSTRHFSNYNSGEIYGLEHTPKRFIQQWIRVYTPFKNLYLAGQDILTVGVGGALFSGAFAAFGILRLKLLWVIRKSLKS